MKVLVTGATGFVGAHTARALHDDGHDLRLLVRDHGRARRMGRAVGWGDDVELVLGDVTDRDSVRGALLGCDAVVHAAGAVSVERKHAAEALTVNTAGAEHVVRGAAELGLDPIVHVSSTSALRYGDLPLGVDDPVAESVGYAASKAAAELVARSLQAAGAPVHITYPAGVIGPAAGEALGETSRGVASFVAGGVLPTRRAAISLVDVRDVAEVHRRLLDPSGPAPARVMCGGARLTMEDLQRELRALTGRRFPIAPFAPGVLRAMGRAADLAASALPYEPSLTEEAMTLITTWPGTDDATARELGVAFRPVRESLGIALDAWLAAGMITRRQRGAAPAG